MAFTITQFREQIDHLLDADDTEMGVLARNKQLQSAIERYSRDVPENVTGDVAGDGGKYYAISSLTSWSEGFSRIISIQYPAYAVTNDETPIYLSQNEWDDDYWASGTRYLFLPNHAPAATETMRIRYTAPYALSSAAYDIPLIDFNAVCHLATALCCLAISTKYARTSDSTILSDSVDHAGRSERFRSQYLEWMKLYEEHIGLRKSTIAGDESGSGGTRPYSSFVDFAKVTGFNDGTLFG